MGEVVDIGQSDTPHRHATLLVVEDEVLIRMLISDFLRDRGFRVLEAANAAEAIQILRTGEVIHVVFTDVHLPGAIDGFGLARWIRHERPEMKVILACGETAEPARDLCDDVPVLAKPYDPHELENRICQFLAR